MAATRIISDSPAAAWDRRCHSREPRGDDELARGLTPSLPQECAPRLTPHPQFGLPARVWGWHPLLPPARVG